MKSGEIYNTETLKLNTKKGKRVRDVALLYQLKNENESSL